MFKNTKYLELNIPRLRGQVLIELTKNKRWETILPPLIFLIFQLLQKYIARQLKIGKRQIKNTGTEDYPPLLRFNESGM